MIEAVLPKDNDNQTTIDYKAEALTTRHCDIEGQGQKARLLYRRKGRINRLRGSLLQAQQSAVLRNKYDHNVLPDLLFPACFTIPECYQNWKLRGTGRFREDLGLCDKMALSPLPMSLS